MIAHYLKTAARLLRKQKLHSILNLAGLALGLACGWVVAVHVAEELRFDAFPPDVASLYRVVRVMPDVHGPSTRNPLGPAVAAKFPEVVSACRTWRLPQPVTLRVATVSFRQDGILFADPEFLPMFGYLFAAGDRGNPLGAPFSAVLTRTAARRFFGPDDPVGRVLSFDGAFEIRVTAVLEDVPRATHLPFEVVLPMEALNRIAPYVYGFPASDYRIIDDWRAGMLNTYLRLRPGASPSALEAKLGPFLRTFAPYNKEVLDERLYLQPVRDIHLHSAYRASGERLSSFGALLAAAAIGVVILLMSCFNYVNLATARFRVRLKETGVRRVLGGRRGDLLLQFSAESSISAGLALLMAFGLIAAARPLLQGILGYPLRLSDFTAGGVVAVAAAAAAACALFSAVYPAAFFAAIPPLGILKGSPVRGRHGFRTGFVLLQFAATIFLTATTGLILAQVRFMKSKDLGYATSQIVVVPVREESLRARPETVRQELLKRPGILAAGFSSALPCDIRQSTTMDLDVGGRRVVFEMSFAAIDPGFLDVYGIDLAAGRGFEAGSASDASGSVILNESAARALGWSDPLGRPLKIFGAERRVVGIVRDFHTQPLRVAIGPTALRPGGPYTIASVKVAGAGVAGALREIEPVFRSFAPDRPFEYSFFDAAFADLYRSEEVLGRSMGIFSGLAVAISALGLFGLAFFLSERRTKEIGIRKVMGASFGGLAGLLARDFARPAILANVVAVPAAVLAIDRWLRNFAYRAPVRPGIFVAAAALALVLTLATVGWQVVRTARAHPADSLRCE